MRANRIAGLSEEHQRTYSVLGVPIAATSLELTARSVLDWATDDVGRFVCVRDVASLMAIRDSEALQPIHSEAALILPDGMPLVAVGKLRGFDVKRTSGPDLVEYICGNRQYEGLSHYFYGGREGVAERMVENFRRMYPSIKIAGYEVPPFHPPSDEEDTATVERILESGADIVWVGISSPKQDLWMLRHYKRFSQTLIGVGAAFDFHAGTVKRAPKWVQRIGMEWSFRLWQEPRRLWRRYILVAPRFVFLCLRDFFSGRL